MALPYPHKFVGCRFYFVRGFGQFIYNSAGPVKKYLVFPSLSRCAHCAFHNRCQIG